MWLLGIVVFAAGNFSGFYIRHRYGSRPWRQLEVWMGTLERRVGRLMSLARRFFEEAPRSELAEFEKEGEVGLWICDHATIQRSNVYRTHGLYGAEMTFQPGRSASIYLRPQQAEVWDWSGFEAFRMDVWNPADRPVTFFLQVADDLGGRFKKKVMLGAGMERRVAVSTLELAQELDLHRIEEVKLFTWETSTRNTFYADQFRLDPFTLEPDQRPVVSFEGAELPEEALLGEDFKVALLFRLHELLQEEARLMVRLYPFAERGRLPGERLCETALQVIPPLPTFRWGVGRLRKIGPFPLRVARDCPAGPYDLEAWLAVGPGGKERQLLYRNRELVDKKVAKIWLKASEATLASSGP